MMIPSKVLAGLIPLASMIGYGCDSAKEEKPNFLIILFDDLGWDDLGVHGNTIIETPHIDKLAAQSARISDFYVNPVCAASRASLLTGRFFLRTGVSHVHGGKDFMATEETTIADVLQQHGYATGMWGKWHNGVGERYVPWQRGFDEAFMARLYQHRNAEGLFNGQAVTTEKWADELIVDYAIDFMERNKENPFFAFVSLLSPHTPLVAPEEVVQKYVEKGLSDNLATLYAMVDYSDQELGRLLSAMDDMGLGNNTIIMLLSDNGPAVNRAELSDHDRQIRYVNRYRGHKGDIWENGVKSPLFIRWPGHVSPGEKHEILDITDIFPTLTELAGISHFPEKPLDGISFKAMLLNNIPADTPHPDVSDTSKQDVPEDILNARFIYNYSNKGWPPSLEPYNPDGNYDEYRPVNKSLVNPKDQVISLRAGRYKLLQHPGVDGVFDTHDSIVLIDLTHDPLETINIAGLYPDITALLRDSLLAWYRDILAAPHAYKPPVVYLLPDQETSIRATWVSDLSQGLLNTVTAVKYWTNDQSGSAHTQKPWAEYILVAEEAGDYEITVHYRKTAFAMPVCTIVAAQAKTISTLINPDHQSIGAMQLKKGTNTIRIIIQPDKNVQSIDELHVISLMPK